MAAAPTDYLKQAGVAIQPGAQSEYDAINAYLATLSAGDRATAIQQIVNPDAGSINFGISPGPLNPLSASQLTAMLAQFKKTYKPAPATQTPAEQQRSAENAAQTNAVASVTAPTAQLPDFTTGQTGAGIPVTGSTGDVPGTTTPNDFNSLLQNYYSSEFSQAGQDPNALAQLSGVTPQMLQQQYAAYTQGFAKAQTAFKPGISGGTVGGQQPMTLPQFAQNKAQAMVGPWAAVLDAIGNIWQSQTGQPMPASVATGIITQLNGMPQNQQSNVLYQASLYMANKASATAAKGLFDQTGSQAASILDALPSTILTYTQGSGTGTGSLGTGGYVGTQMEKYPGVLQTNLVTSNIVNAFETALNRTPTAADFAALGTDPTSDEINNYIANQPMPGVPGMTYGAYHGSLAALTQQGWTQLFGHPPSTAEIRWAVGKSGEDISSFINNSSSSIPGITIGQKNDYETFIDGLDKGTGGGHGLSAGIDDSLIKDLHGQITKASTGTAAPGAM